MKTPNLYIIAGCNGAGKTTASFTMLPEMLNCREFVNAGSIAAALSPFNPESVAFEAGRIMLKRIRQLIQDGVDFAFETTLATRSYVSLIKEAKEKGYRVNLVYFWLNSQEEARQRVAIRVSQGGHHIPADVIERRYQRGMANLLTLYIPVCNYWVVIDNSANLSELVAQGESGTINTIYNSDIWDKIISVNHED